MSKKGRLVLRVLTVVLISPVLINSISRRLQVRRIDHALGDAWTTFDRAAAARDQPAQQYSLIKLLITKSYAAAALMRGGGFTDWKRFDNSMNNLGRCQNVLIIDRNVFQEPAFNDAMRVQMTKYLSSCIEKHEVIYD